uniref:Uncharacterized protein n=1 Tax=viral metagenome TaxID=1070528 RepID=A0A6H1ZY07_9ZZZZ
MPNVEFYGEIRKETDNAYLVFDGINEVWLPKSQIVEMNHEKGPDYEFIIPEWLAIEKEIV